MIKTYIACVGIMTLCGVFSVGCSHAAENGFPPLPYAYDALEPHIDALTMEIHYDRHHRAYYNNYIQARKDEGAQDMTLEDILAQISAFSTTMRNNAGGHYNHVLFWEVMSPDGGGEPEGALAEAITETFGSFDAFRERFTAAALTRFGSGWAWLGVAEDGTLFVSSTANQDNPLMDVVTPRGLPILGLDVWEHAYYLLYQNRRGAYIDAFWHVVNWEDVAERYAAALAALEPEVNGE